MPRKLNEGAEFFHVDLRTQEIEIGCIGLFIDPEIPKLEYTGIVTKVTRLHLDLDDLNPRQVRTISVQIISVNYAEYAGHVGKVIELTLDPNGRIVPGFIAHTEEDRALVQSGVHQGPFGTAPFHIYDLLRRTRKRQVSYAEIFAYLEALQILPDEHKNYVRAAIGKKRNSQKWIAALLRKHTHLLVRSPGGYVRLRSRELIHDADVVATNVPAQEVRVVSLPVLMNGIREFVIALCESGILGKIDLRR